MKRRLFNLLAAVSLVLCVLSAVAWWQSIIASRYLVHTSWNSSQRIRLGWGADLWGGRLFVSRTVTFIPISEWHSANLDGWNYNSFNEAFEFAKIRPDYFELFRFGRFRTGTGPRSPPGDGWSFGIRLWPIMMLTALVPGFWLALRARTRRRVKSGACRRCGYDLRASKERCPECGTAIPAGGPAAAAEAK